MRKFGTPRKKTKRKKRKPAKTEDGQISSCHCYGTSCKLRPAVKLGSVRPSDVSAFFAITLPCAGCTIPRGDRHVCEFGRWSASIAMMAKDVKPTRVRHVLPRAWCRVRWKIAAIINLHGDKHSQSGRGRRRVGLLILLPPCSRISVRCEWLPEVNPSDIRIELRGMRKLPESALPSGAER
jgi:hypothetical protein